MIFESPSQQQIFPGLPAGESVVTFGARATLTDACGLVGGIQMCIYIYTYIEIPIYVCIPDSYLCMYTSTSVCVYNVCMYMYIRFMMRLETRHLL